MNFKKNTSFNNPWITQSKDIPSSHSFPRRAARRRPASHDPLLSPSSTDKNHFAHTVGKRAQNTLLECLDDAIESPLPRLDIQLMNVKSDRDFELAGIYCLDNSTCNSSVYGPYSGDPLQNTTFFKTDVNERGPISSSDPQSILSRFIRNNDNAPILAYGNSIVNDSEKSSNCTPSIHPNTPRTIKTIRHHIVTTDTIEGIAVQYGIPSSSLKRMNRLWSSNEMFTRTYLYIPLRLCSYRFTLQCIEYANSKSLYTKDPVLESYLPPVDLIEIVLDPYDNEDSVQGIWPRISYNDLKKYISFMV